jgi:hypothetical protein
LGSLFVFKLGSLTGKRIPHDNLLGNSIRPPAKTFASPFLEVPICSADNAKNSWHGI